MRQVKYISLALFLASCGQSTKNPMELKEVQMGAKLSTGIEIAKSEKAAALRICYAFQSKNSTLRSPSHLNTNYKFKINHTDCAKKKLAENIDLTTTLKQTLAPPLMSSFQSLQISQPILLLHLICQLFRI